MKRVVVWGVLVVLGLSGPALGQGDPDVIARIVKEGKENSRVWEYLRHLSEDIGTRLTGSTGLIEANAWTRDVFRSHGLADAHLQKWGEIPVRFDRGPSSARMVKPAERDFEFTTRSWSAGTRGGMRGTVLKSPQTLEAVEEQGDQLKGAWILTKPQARRRWRRRRSMSDEEKAAQEVREQLREQIREKLYESGIAGRIVGSRSELVFTGGSRGWRELEFDAVPSDVTVTVRRSDYDAMNSRLADGEEVEVEIDLQNHFVEGPFGLYNTIAEIPGTEKPNEVVIISGHIDTWDGPGTQGAQDNGTGCAVALEAARILMAVEAKPKRTIRFCLWAGEEQGLLGSRAYVEGLSEEEKAGISAVFVDDGGTNYEGGLSCIASMEPMLREATAPVNEAFPDKKVEIRVRERMPRGGGSDHASFNRAGIPGFFWDEVGSGGREGKNYRFIHHTQNDTMRYAIRDYLVQSATCSAITAYNLAMAETLLPRQEPERPDAEEARPDEPEKPFNVVPGPVTGAWKLTLSDEDATVTLEMSDDGRVRGTLDSVMGGGPVTKCSFDSATHTVKFAYRTEMGLINFQATVKGNEMTGMLSVGDRFSREFTATRTVPTTAPAEPAAGKEGQSS